jgi:cation transport ATPase
MPSNEARRVDPQTRHRTLMIIWGAILTNVIVFFVLANVIAPDTSRLSESNTLSFVLAAVATFVTIGSYFFRQKMLARAAEQQRPESVSSAYIVAFAMCELAALCGFMLRYLTSERSYYFLFIIAVFGLVLNLPKRDDIINASTARRI